MVTGAGAIVLTRQPRALAIASAARALPPLRPQLGAAAFSLPIVGDCHDGDSYRQSLAEASQPLVARSDGRCSIREPETWFRSSRWRQISSRLEHNSSSARRCAQQRAALHQRLEDRVRGVSSRLLDHRIEQPELLKHSNQLDAVDGDPQADGARLSRASAASCLAGGCGHWRLNLVSHRR